MYSILEKTKLVPLYSQKNKTRRCIKIIGIRNYPLKMLKEQKLSTENNIKLNKLEEGKKISIFSDSMFKTMLQNENRLKYSAKLLSYYLEIEYEDLLKNIRLSKNELDKKKKREKGERCDYVANINGSVANIEVNNNSKVETLERNIEYAFRLFAKEVTEDDKEYNYTQVIQLNYMNFFIM